MDTSTNITKISSALLLFSMKVDKIEKNATNPFFKSKYASLSNILMAIKTPLQESGLCIIQLPEAGALTTMLIHAESGEYFKCTVPINPLKNDPQAVGSAITYFRRYAITAILCLDIEEDDDGNAATKAEKKAPEKPAKTFISDKQFTQLCDRVAKGDVDAARKAVDTFAFSEAHRLVLDGILNNLSHNSTIA